MSFRASLQRPLNSAVALAATAVLAAPLRAAPLDDPPRTDPIAGRRPALPTGTPAPTAPSTESEAGRVRVRVSKEAPGLELGDPEGLFSYLLTPAESRPPALAAVPRSPFSAPTIGAAPSGGTRWLWFLPLAMLPFFTDGNGKDQQTSENTLPDTPPITPPATPPATPPGPPVPPGTPFESPPPAAPPVSTVPEPTTLVLLGVGMLGVGAVARRRRG